MDELQTLLRRSHRTKLRRLAFTGVFLVAIFGALTIYDRTHVRSIGESENLEAVMIVRASSHRYAREIEAVYFHAVEGTMAELEREAQRRLSRPDAVGVPAILELADLLGYAFVAFEDPATLDLSGLDLAAGAPPVTAGVPFAVISVGDFASPHRLTISTPRSDTTRERRLDILSALLKQEALAFVEAPPPASVESTFADRIIPARSLVSRIAPTEWARAEIEVNFRGFVEAGERGEVAVALGVAMEESRAFALADGSTLLARRDLHLIPDSPSPQLTRDTTWRFECLPAGALELAAATPVPSLMGGLIVEPDKAPRFLAEPPETMVFRLETDMVEAHTIPWTSFRLADTQDTILIDANERSSVWTLDAAAGPCQFKGLGALPAVAAGRDVGTPHASGHVVRVSGDINVVQAGERGEQRLLRLYDLVASSARWLDDQHLAILASSRSAMSEDQLYFAAEYLPDLLVRVDLRVLDDAGSVAVVAPMPAAEGDGRPRILIATELWSALYMVTLDRTYESLFDAAAARDPRRKPSKWGPRGAREPALVEHRVRTQDVVRLAQLDRTARQIAVAPAGDRVALLTGRGVVGVLEIGAPGAVRWLPGSVAEPTWTADGRRVVVHARAPLSQTLGDATRTVAGVYPGAGR